MNIRDRIKELRSDRAGEQRPHPRNWLTQPEAQQNALRGMLAEIGYDALVPVLVVDLDDKEAE